VKTPLVSRSQSWPFERLAQKAGQCNGAIVARIGSVLDWLRCGYYHGFLPTWREVSNNHISLKISNGVLMLSDGKMLQELIVNFVGTGS
jgi:hypothetical protein